MENNFIEGFEKTAFTGALATGLGKVVRGVAGAGKGAGNIVKRNVGKAKSNVRGLKEQAKYNYNAAKSGKQSIGLDSAKKRIKRKDQGKLAPAKGSIPKQTKAQRLKAENQKLRDQSAKVKSERQAEQAAKAKQDAYDKSPIGLAKKNLPGAAAGAVVGAGGLAGAQEYKKRRDQARINQYRYARR